jgi:hypothetical protein
MGMAHPAWKTYPALEKEPKQFTLRVMVALETLAIILLAVETTARGEDVNWFTLLKLTGIVITVYLISFPVSARI